MTLRIIDVERVEGLKINNLIEGKPLNNKPETVAYRNGYQEAWENCQEIMKEKRKELLSTARTIEEEGIVEVMKKTVEKHDNRMAPNTEVAQAIMSYLKGEGK
jgi:hypothetical protein